MDNRLTKSKFIQEGGARSLPSTARCVPNFESYLQCMQESPIDLKEPKPNSVGQLGFVSEYCSNVMQYILVLTFS